ncbi:hypothetical protein [Microcoleus sp.]|uniref:hypothetical protein n=1 Tax=Microcoleus sp. TaxID=44472 RepID=UPI00403EA377
MQRPKPIRTFRRGGFQTRPAESTLGNPASTVDWKQQEQLWHQHRQVWTPPLRIHSVPPTGITA